MLPMYFEMQWPPLAPDWKSPNDSNQIPIICPEEIVSQVGCRSGLSRHHRHHNKKPSGNHSLDAHQKYLLSVYKSFQAGNEYFALKYTNGNWVIIIWYFVFWTLTMMNWIVLLKAHNGSKDISRREILRYENLFHRKAVPAKNISLICTYIVKLASVWHRMWIVDPDKIQKVLLSTTPWLWDDKI